MENEQESKVPLKLLVDEKKERVVAAEAKVDFMDILVSLLTLPMGTIIRLIKAEAGVVGCMNNLYQSVENLSSEEDLFGELCKTMLLNPRNPYPKYCMRLKVNVDDLGSEKYHVCSKCTMFESGNLSSIAENGTSKDTNKLELKLTLRKSTNEVLCAEAGNEFIDFLFNILTIPIGSIEDALKGTSGLGPLGCIDNLYRSVETLDSKWFNTPPKRNTCIFGSEENNNHLKTILLKPCVAPHHNSESQLLQITEGKAEIYNLFDPRQNINGSYCHKFRKFVKEPSLFYVLDNLEVRPVSSTSTIRLLQELNLPINDIEEQITSVGQSEALSLLKASLASSSSALPEGLNLKQIDTDVKCNSKELSWAGYKHIDNSFV